MKRRSLRTRLAVTVAFATAALLLAANIAIFLGFRGMLHRSFDRTLEAHAAAIAPLVEFEDGRLEFEMDREDWPAFLRQQRASVRVTAPGGRELFRSGDLPPMHRPPRPFAMTDGPEPMKVHRRLLQVQPGGPPHRRPPGPVEVELIVAMPARAIHDQLAALGWVLGAVTLGASAAVAGVAYAVAAVGLRPVRRLVGEIDRLTPDELGQQIGEADLPAELAPVAARLNALLQRIDAAVQRERGFTADVAHELRTPLAGLRTVAEVALQQERSPEAYRAAMQKTLGITDTLQSLVERLLTLARLDAHRTELHIEPVQLAPLVHRALATLGEQVEERPGGVELDLPGGAGWRADPSLAAVIVQNLVSNAVAHGDPTEPIRIAAEDRGASLELRISNGAAGLTEADVPHLFERFWRASAAREQAAGHAGLGLALVQRAVDLQGGSVSAVLEDGRLTIRVALRGIEGHGR